MRQSATAPTDRPHTGSGTGSGSGTRASVAALIAVALIGGAGAFFWHRSAPIRAELAGPTSDTDAALARLVADGLPQHGVTIRDWAAIDGDGVEANGVRLIAGAEPQPLILSPGVLVLKPIAGTRGCVSLEITAPGRPPYQLCLRPDAAIPEVPVR